MIDDPHIGQQVWWYDSDRRNVRHGVVMSMHFCDPDKGSLPGYAVTIRTDDDVEVLGDGDVCATEAEAMADAPQPASSPPSPVPHEAEHSLLPWPKSYTHAQSDGMFACLLAWARIPLSTEGRTEPDAGAFDAVIRLAREEVCKVCPDGIERVVGRGVSAVYGAVMLVEHLGISAHLKYAWRLECSNSAIGEGAFYGYTDAIWLMVSVERWHPSLDWRVDDSPDPGPLEVVP